MRDDDTSAGAAADDEPNLLIAAAADLAALHPQTLRYYDRIELVVPSRAPGRARRYSARDVRLLQRVTELSALGVSLEGVRRVLHLESRVAELEAELSALRPH